MALRRRRRARPVLSTVVTGGALPPPSELELSRRAWRRSRARRSTLVALASTLLFAVVAYLAVTRSPGWPRVQTTFFSASVALESLPEIARGLLVNLQVLVVGGLLVLVVGLGIAALRTLRGPALAPLRFLATAYVDLFRGMPLIIVLYLVGFGFPALGLQGVPTSPFVLGTAAIVLVYSAYVAEVFRAGIESVHPSQRAAARSLGLTHRQTMRIVVLPQALRTVTPALLNDFVALQKDVGLISVLGAVDAVRSAQIQVGQSFNFTPYVVAGLLFVLLAVPSARLADAVTARARRRQQSGSLL
ncbi:amino acid ABC transporter permease [Geodermatophilus aquaeductus]|uniref:Amino acid ABC transporter membrane protein, PAAT family n=1 Tax=Geodermatophilus aquaeductus TaxID=1564161 RepID=A0A521DS66_9ACTN|nr:amino acid ABC transporter permease [Geodermatophilus aquaeductus]SMO74001.1 amino acid ABC transporter membrane protein, PAAT family [Geodermatophilus aquaeductus]